MFTSSFVVKEQRIRKRWSRGRLGGDAVEGTSEGSGMEAWGRCGCMLHRLRGLLDRLCDGSGSPTKGTETGVPLRSTRTWEGFSVRLAAVVEISWSSGSDGRSLPRAWGQQSKGLTVFVLLSK